MATWDEVDDRGLRWLLDHDANPDWARYTDKLTLRPSPEPQAACDNELDARQVDEALTRLSGHGVIASERTLTTHYVRWSKLRLTAQGLVLLGEWPDLDRVASAQGLTILLAELTILLAELAEGANDPNYKKALRRTAGAVSRLGEGIVGSAVESLGSELAS